MRTRPRIAAKALAVVTAVVAIAAATPSGATTTSTPSMSESMSQPYVAVTGVFSNGTTVGGYVITNARFTVPSWAKYVSVVLQDATNLPARGFVDFRQPSGNVTFTANFCGRTSQPYPVDPTAVSQIEVAVLQGPCTDSTLAIGTTGTITVTFTD